MDEKEEEEGEKETVGAGGKEMSRIEEEECPQQKRIRSIVMLHLYAVHSNRNHLLVYYYPKVQKKALVLCLNLKYQAAALLKIASFIFILTLNRSLFKSVSH